MTLRGPDGTGSTPRSGHAYSGVGRGPDSQNEFDSAALWESYNHTATTFAPFTNAFSKLLRNNGIRAGVVNGAVERSANFFRCQRLTEKVRAIQAL